MAGTLTESEFSHPVPVDELGEGEMVIEIAADAEERAALAQRFGLLALDRLAATVRLKRVDRESVRFVADFAAEVVQACVVPPPNCTSGRRGLRLGSERRRRDSNPRGRESPT